MMINFLILKGKEESEALNSLKYRTTLLQKKYHQKNINKNQIKQKTTKAHAALTKCFDIFLILILN